MLPPRNQPLGGKLTGAGGAQMTPAQIAQQKQIAAALMQQAGDTSPVGHWTAALNRGLQGWLGGNDMYNARTAESEGVANALARFNARGTGGTGSAGGSVASALAGGGSYTAPAEAAAIREGLISRGLPEHVADGFVMNFQDESGLNPGINERNPTVPGSRGGFGLYQLTGDRRTAYENFAGQRGVDPSDVDAQLDWLMYELQGPEAKAAQSILGATNAGEAGAAIVNHFLRPAPEHRQSRAARYMGAGAGPYAAPGAGNVQEIAALLADPFLPDSARGVLQAEMQQQMSMQNAAYQQQLQMQDPAYQLQMQSARLGNERAQLELDRMRAPQPDKVRYEFAPNGQLVQINETAGSVQGLGDYGAPQGSQSAIGKIQDDLRAGNITPEQAELAMSQLGNNVNVNMGGPELGKLSTDFGYVLGPDGKPVIDPVTGLPTAAPVPGSPAAISLKKEAESKDKRDTNASNTANIVLQDIEKALNQTNGWTAGFGGKVLGLAPGTGATDLRATMDTIKANIGFDRLQQMRESSPTGGALGGIAVQELNMLQAVLGSLDQSQSPEQLMSNLERLRDIYVPIAAKAAAYPNAAQFGFGGGKPAGKENPAPSTSDDDLFKKYGIQ